MKRKGLIFVFLGALLSLESMAAFVCYSEDNYPAVHILGLNDYNQPRLALVGKFADRKNKHIPFLEKTDKGWVETTEHECKPFYKCLSRSKGCHVKIPEIKLSVEELMNYRSLEQKPEWVQQSISACVEDADDVYFGISFYEGEGGDGLGGIGKFNTKTKQGYYLFKNKV